MTRTYAIGDPQGPFAKVLEVLDRHGLLAGDRLADDVVLVSIGDHFDYDHRDPARCAREGLALLRWLASHDPAQVHLLLGNHDAARVMELALVSDADFAHARTCTLDAYPAHLPPQHVLQRDYASFTVEQRELVADLLRAGRFHLALAAELAGRTALLTHAGVTTRELALLDVQGDAPAIAAALELHLRSAVARGVAPLSLAPLHRAGADGEEGDGLLYHRPSARPQPRRFDPRTLPDGLLQIAGHSGHAKCLHELGGWCTARATARAHGGIRTLTRTGAAITYDLGIDPAGHLVLIDGELRRVPAAEVELLPLDRVR